METDVREELLIWVLEDLILAPDDDITDGDLLAMINKEKGWSHATLEEAHAAAFPGGYGEWSREKEAA